MPKHILLIPVTMMLSASVLLLPYALFTPASTKAKLVSHNVPDTVRSVINQSPRPHLYEALHALVIGMKQYQHSVWNRLDGVPEDVAEVKEVLERQGFIVETAMNLGGSKLRERIEKFISDYGYRKECGLLIYYTGHGYALKSAGSAGDVGYIVPVDAPDPEADKKGFLQTAISMNTIREYALEIEAKHTLFVFDSCFSGSLIQAIGKARLRLSSGSAMLVQSAFSLKPPEPVITSDLPDSKDYILEMARLPVRQFITSGTNKQEVPDDSAFREKFVNALDGESNNNADANLDNYVTATELGDYLKTEIITRSKGSQQPLSEKIEDPALRQGDFIFSLTRPESLPLNFNPERWTLPSGWTFKKNALNAQGRGFALPKDAYHFSYRNFTIESNFIVRKETSVQFALRVRDKSNYYLIRLTGGSSPDRAQRYTLQAFVVKDGMKTSLPQGSLSINSDDLQREIRRERPLQIKIEVLGKLFKVEISSREGYSLAGPYQFYDDDYIFKSGTIGFLIENEEQFQINSFAVTKSKLF